jgi:sporulation protein YlmC with PRC-barrel domain
MSVSTHNTSDESHEDTLGDLLGLEVYTINGTYVGRVDDLRLDFGMKKLSGIALSKVNYDVAPEEFDARSSKGILLPYRWLHSVDDVVIISDVFERLVR